MSPVQRAARATDNKFDFANKLILLLLALTEASLQSYEYKCGDCLADLVPNCWQFLISEK